MPAARIAAALDAGELAAGTIAGSPPARIRALARTGAAAGVAAGCRPIRRSTSGCQRAAVRSGLSAPWQPTRPNDRDIAVNRRAWHDYHIEETFEAGLVLTGSEVKALRDGKANLKDSYGRIRTTRSSCGTRTSARTGRRRSSATSRRARASCCCTARRSSACTARSRKSGLTLIPLRLYFKNGRAKVELGLARGKKHHDKRDAIREREVRREIDRAISDRRQKR